MGAPLARPLFLKGTHFEQAPALPGLPGSVATQPFRSGGAKWNLVNEGAVGTLIFLWMWRRDGPLVTFLGCGKRSLILFPRSERPYLDL